MPSREPDILRPDGNRLTAVLLGIALLIGLRIDAELLCRQPYREAGVLAKLVGFPASSRGVLTSPRFMRALIIRPPGLPAYAIVGNQAHTVGTSGSPMPAHAVAEVYEMSLPSGVGLWHAEYRARDGDITIEPLGAHTINEARARLYLSLIDRTLMRETFRLVEAPAINTVDIRESLSQGWFRHARGATPRLNLGRLEYDLQGGRVSWPRVLHSAVAMAAMLGAILCFLYALPRPLFRRPPGQCQACGYNREGLTSQPCPECGAAASSAAVKDPSPS